MFEITEFIFGMNFTLSQLSNKTFFYFRKITNQRNKENYIILLVRAKLCLNKISFDLLLISFVFYKHNSLGSQRIQPKTRPFTTKTTHKNHTCKHEGDSVKKLVYTSHNIVTVKGMSSNPKVINQQLYKSKLESLWIM